MHKMTLNLLFLSTRYNIFKRTKENSKTTLLQKKEKLLGNWHLLKIKKKNQLTHKGLNLVDCF